jgi:hypothetical protein
VASGNLALLFYVQQQGFLHASWKACGLASEVFLQLKNRR